MASYEEIIAKIVKINYTNISNFAKVSIQVVTSKVACPLLNQLRYTEIIEEGGCPV
jgi:hypothetical protein